MGIIRAGAVNKLEQTGADAVLLIEIYCKVVPQRLMQ